MFTAQPSHYLYFPCPEFYNPSPIVVQYYSRIHIRKNNKWILRHNQTLWKQKNVLSHCVMECLAANGLSCTRPPFPRSWCLWILPDLAKKKLCKPLLCSWFVMLVPPLSVCQSIHPSVHSNALIACIFIFWGPFLRWWMPPCCAPWIKLLLAVALN